MINWTIIITLLNPVIMLGIVIGGIWAFRSSKLRVEHEIRERVIAAYKEESEIQEKELVRLRHEVTAMREAFKQLGMEIEIERGIITVIDGRTAKRRRIIQIPEHKEED